MLGGSARGHWVPNHIQISLFLQDPPKANKVAEACFPELEIVSFNSQGDQSLAELASDYEFGVASSVGLARIDFIWEPISTPPNFNYSEIDIDDLKAYFKSIESYAADITVNRVACVLSTNSPFSSLKEAINGVKIYVPEFEIIDGATEIFFRINVPKEISGFHINRLMSIQTANSGFVKITLGGQREQKLEKIMRVSVDVNSDQMKSLPRGKAGEALAVVREEARRLVVDGIGSL